MRCRRSLLVGLVLSASSGLIAQSPPLTPFRGLIDHVSVDQWGSVPYENVEIWHRAISGDGRHVVMGSRSSNLATGDYDDYNGYDDIFLRDRMTGTTTRISRSFDGGSGDGLSQMGTISTNGRHVAFASGSTNLVPGDTNNHWDVFVRDLDQQRTVRVSVATDGTQGDRDAYYPSLSADGRFVAFLSWATTLAPGVSSSAPRQIYLHDRDADSDGIFDEPGDVTTELISVGLTGGIADDSVDSPRVSGDGRVLFESAATNLSDVGNPNAMNHLYLRDRLTGQTALIDRAVTGGPSSYGVGYGTSDMTDDGRFITFSSISPDIVWFDMNWQSQVLRYDTVAGPTATTIVSRLPDGTVGDGSSYASSVSADGRYVLFTTAASNLASPPPGASGPAMLAVRDMLDASVARVDVLDSGEAFDQSDYYYTPAVSADGTAIVLQSRSVNAVGGAFTYGASHALVLTGLSASPASASYPMAGGSGSIEVNALPVSGWNAWSPDEWIVLTDGGGFGAGPRTVQYVVSPNDAGIIRSGSIRIGSKVIPIQQQGDGDTTPPVITPIITGTLGQNGWYTSDIVVEWSVSDPDSEITGQIGCGGISFTIDFVYASPTCEATSHGGTTSVSVPLKRDTTPPVVTIGTPTQTIYSAGSVVTPWYNCSDASGFSGVATCALTQGSSPLDTTPGRHVVTVTGTDAAGNSASRSVEYMVGSGVCVLPSVSPADYLKVWLPLNGGTDPWRDRASGGFFGPMLASGGFPAAVVGAGWANGTAGNYLISGYPASNYTIDTVQAGEGLTIAAWVKPEFSSTGTILSNPLQYRVARFPDGTLRWAFNQESIGFTWRNTGVVLPPNAWSHVAVTYKNGNVRTYLNGRLVSNAWVFGYLQTTGDPNAGLTVAGRADASESLLGVIDDVLLFKEALSDADIESIALAGSGSLCVPYTSAITLTAPSTLAYGATFPVTALLTDGSGTPLAEREIEIGSRVGPAGYLYQFNTRTGADGTATVQLPVSSSATLGFYANAITAYFPGGVSHQSSQIVQGATLVAGTPTITWSPAAIVYGTALGASQLNATANVPGTFTYSPAAGTILDAGTQTLSVTFSPDDTSHWAPTTKTATLVVNKATPTVTATGGTFTYDNQPHAGSGAATGVFGESLAPVTLSYDGASSTPPTQAGNHTVRAAYAGSQNYLAGQSADATLTINRATPTVEISTAPVWYTGYARTATVFVRGIDGVELYPYTVLYNGSTTAPVNAGTYTLEVQFAGNTNYEPVTATGSFVIRKNFPIFPTLNDIFGTYDGQSWGVNVIVIGVMNEHLTPVITTYNGATDAPINAGVYTAVVRYDGSANYEADSRTFTVTIAKALPYVQWGIPASIIYETPLGGSQLNATVDVPGTFEYSPTAGTVLNVGTHTLTATFTPADAQNYETRTISRSISVTKRTIWFTWSRPADIVYGTPLGPTQLNATAGVPGTFTYSPLAGTILGAGNHVLNVAFTPDDTWNYDGSSGGVGFTVTKATPVLSWSSPAEITYGTALGGSQLNATANVPGTFSYSPAAGTVLGAGTQTLSVAFTPDDAANYNGASADISLTVTKAAPIVMWADPTGITYGTPLSSAQLNATANVAGTFAYSPAGGTVLGAGTQSLSATFTPDDSANYATATANVSIAVAKAVPVITWTDPAGITYGTALSGTQLNATANVNGSFVYSPAAGTVLGAGAHNLSATFTPADGANYTLAAASSSIAIATAALTVQTNNSSKVYGEALPAFTATGTGFVNGDSMASLSGTLAFVTSATATSAPGAYAVTPSGVSSANYSIAFAAGTLTVTKAATSLTLTTTPNPSQNNQTVQLRAVVSAVAPGAGLPTGTVEFRENGTLLGTATLVNGVATMNKNFKKGTHPLTATYAGNANFTGSSGQATHLTP